MKSGDVEPNDRTRSANNLLGLGYSLLSRPARRPARRTRVVEDRRSSGHTHGPHSLFHFLSQFHYHHRTVDLRLKRASQALVSLGRIVGGYLQGLRDLELAAPLARNHQRQWLV